MAIHFYVHSTSISMPFRWHECHIALHPNENDKYAQNRGWQLILHGCRSGTLAHIVA